MGRRKKDHTNKSHNHTDVQLRSLLQRGIQDPKDAVSQWSTSSKFLPKSILAGRLESPNMDSLIMDSLSMTSNILVQNSLVPKVANSLIANT